MGKVFSGFTSKTGENLVLDAGAFFTNFIVDTDTYESAVTEGKLIGATRGGGTFNAVPEIRTIEVDGVKGRAKGLEAIDSWDVSMVANVLEMTPESIQLALAASTKDTTTSTNYDIIKAKNSISAADYIDNITWIGTLSGSDKPVIIQIYNALNVTGIALNPQDKNETITQLTLTGHYDTNDLDNPPFAIYYPKIA